jgi:hypothetical protein
MGHQTPAAPIRKARGIEGSAGWLGSLAASVRRRPAVAVLAVACAGYLAVFLWLLRDVGLANDEWEWLLYRMSSWHGFIDPYNNQPVIGEIAFYRVWAHVVGVGHHWVVALVYGLLQVGVALLVFDLARRRVGDWAGAGVAILVLFMGRAWEALLAPPGVTFVLSVFAGCAAWAVLDRRPRPVRDFPAGAALAVAAVSGGPIPGVLGGLVAEVAAGRRWRRLAVVTAGVLPFAAWYAWYLTTGGTTEVHTSANAPHVPWWAVRLVSASAAAAVGLPREAGPAVIALAAVGIVVLRRARRPARSPWTPRALGLVTALVLAVLATGAARAGDTPPTTSRYLYFPATVMLLLACEMLAGMQLRRRRAVALAGSAAVLAAVGLGVQQLRDGKVDYLRSADGTAARLGALRLVDGYASPDYQVLEPSRLSYTPATVDRFVRRFGSEPIDTEAELARALPESRAAADGLLAALLVHPIRHRAGGCRPLQDGAAIPPGDWTVLADRPATLAVWRFADPRAGASVTIPPRGAVRVVGGGIARPWRLAARGGAALSLCP